MQFVRRLDNHKPAKSPRRYLAYLNRRRAVVSVIIPDGPSLLNFQVLCLPSLQAKAGLRRLLFGVR